MLQLQLVAMGAVEVVPSCQVGPPTSAHHLSASKNTCPQRQTSPPPLCLQGLWARLHMHSMWVSCVCVWGGGGGCCALDNHPDWGGVLAEGVIFEAADDDADHEAQNNG